MNKCVIASALANFDIFLATLAMLWQLHEKPEPNKKTFENLHAKE